MQAFPAGADFVLGMLIITMLPIKIKIQGGSSFDEETVTKNKREGIVIVG